MVNFAPGGPKDKDAVDFDRLSVTPGAMRMRCQNRSDMVTPSKSTDTPDRGGNYLLDGFT
jgi:hypothetical protein